MKTMIATILIGAGLMTGCRTVAPGGLVAEAERKSLTIYVQIYAD